MQLFVTGEYKRISKTEDSGSTLHKEFNSELSSASKIMNFN